KIEGVRAVEKVISDLVLIEYGEKQHLLLLKGVDPDYGGQSGFDSLLIDGSFVLQDEGVDYGVMGAIAAGTLQLNLNSNEFVKVYYPKRTRKNLGNPTDAFQTRYLTPIGVFCSYTEYDNEYLICSIEFAANLMSYENQVTSVEIFVNNENETDNIQQQITQILGDKYVVKNRFQQEELLFKTMKSEKMIIFSILAFILIIAGFNIIGSLGMIVIEKKEDMAVLHHLGANKSMIRRIFMLEGMIISFVGGVIGMLIGLGVCILQQIFHIISFGGDSGSYIIDYYPVKIEALDFLIVFGTIFIISFIASLIPIKNLQFKNEIKK
ncbi:MAG TPA: FtsX-like permease family protein, partial [Bacteroidales bacterium]|nr:FtsX-like permease family protein [Bacteroidales bacterium]